MAASISWTRMAILLASPLSLCGCSMTGAELTQPVSYDFECDVPPGHYSGWSRSLNGSNVAISGTMQIKKFRSDSRWAPSATIRADLGGNKYIALHVVHPPGAGSTWTAALDTGESGSGRMIGRLNVDPSKLINYSFELSQRSSIRVSIAGIRGSERLMNAVPKSVQLGCSTADIHFGDTIISTN